ncbi:hypothetical protein GPNADHDJ_00085 [Stenotrophomonas maltophilia]|uniref:TonB-dependent receptor plug domain-containing protein n=1 Tax=Stenotrophomonas maltophilia TaxID=40324 RepID=A0AAX1I9H3_STEMA|nr:hypothetical protein GPNADHDJ_00085 [Stenotrophomonas maltophilia]
MNVQDISNLDAQVPNLTIYAARGASSTITAYIRGIGQSDPTWGADPGVGIYLDDVYIARPQGALLDVFDVSRIEVLRGPQGKLCGKNTIGGAIKYISRGLPTQTEGFAQITMGNYSQLDAKAAIGGPIGGANSGLRARVAVASMNHDGFGENTFNGQPVSDKQINAARLNLGAYAGDDFDVQFALDWIDDQPGMRGSKMLAPNPFLRAYPPMDSRYDIRSGMRTRYRGGRDSVVGHHPQPSCDCRGSRRAHDHRGFPALDRTRHRRQLRADAGDLRCAAFAVGARRQGNPDVHHGWPGRLPVP